MPTKGQFKLMELPDKGFNPARIIADDGSGLRADHKMLLPDVPCDSDVFPMISKLMHMRLFFTNRLKSSTTDRVVLEEQIRKAEMKGKTHKNKDNLLRTIEHEETMAALCASIDTLLQWMQQDVFHKAGTDLTERQPLYDFIVTELMKLEDVQTHRIKEVRIALQNQRDQLLSFVSLLDQQGRAVATKYQVPINTLFQVCELLKGDIRIDKYAIRSIPLQDDLAEKFEAIEDEVIDILSNTQRTNAMIENRHSTIRPYSNAQRG